MPFTLEQVVIPVGVLGSQPDPASAGDVAGWLDYFYAQISAMRVAMPCQCKVRLGATIAGRMYGEALPEIDPSESLQMLTQCGSDRLGMRVFYDTELDPDRVRLE